MKTNKKPFLYKLGANILGPIFMHHYHPIVKGIENIPSEGPVILAGNHIHLYDQCTAIVLSKRYIKYMAKKEYFDSWKTRWFFKGVGCISVNRETKDTTAVDTALKWLKNDGMIGIFPEGTRNGLKDKHILEFYNLYFTDMDKNEFTKKLHGADVRLSELNYLCELYNQNIITLKELKDNFYTVDDFLKKLLKNKKITQKDYLDNLFLPLKFGAVSMAKKTNALIVPVVITGRYVKNGKFVVNFGKPIKVSDDLEKSNTELRKNFIKLASDNLNSQLEMK